MASASDRYYRNLNRQNITPKTSLSTAGFTPAVTEAFAFTPEKEDMSLLQRSIATLDERREKTDQQRAAIMSALGNLKLNAAEDKWKADYANRIGAQIDSAAQFGDYSTALETATRLAGEAITSPEVMGRVRANEQYEAWRNDIEERATSGKIDRRTANRLLEENPYNFEDIKDETGKIVGGYSWRDNGGRSGGPVDTAVNKISLESIFQAVDNIVAEHAHSDAGYSARDANGNPTGLYGDDATFFTKSSGSVREKRLSDLKVVFNELVTQHSEIGAYLEQMKKDDAWEINKLEQEITSNPTANDTYAKRQKVKELKDRLYSTNGLGIISTAEYLDKMSKGSIKAMAYRNIDSDVSMSGGKSKNTSPTSPTNPTDPYNRPIPHSNFTGKASITGSKNTPSSSSMSEVADGISKYIARPSDTK